MSSWEGTYEYSAPLVPPMASSAVFEISIMSETASSIKRLSVSIFFRKAIPQITQFRT